MPGVIPISARGVPVPSANVINLGVPSSGYVKKMQSLPSRTSEERYAKPNALIAAATPSTSSFGPAGTVIVLVTSPSKFIVNVSAAVNVGSELLP